MLLQFVEFQYLSEAYCINIVCFIPGDIYITKILLGCQFDTEDRIHGLGIHL